MSSRSPRSPRPWLCAAALALAALAAPPHAAAQTPCEEDPTECAPPTVTFAPPSGASYTATTATHPLQVTLRWCSNAPLQAASRQVRFNGTIVTSRFTFAAGAVSGCASHGATSVGTVALLPGSNTVVANLASSDGLDGAGRATYAYARQTVGPPPYAVAVAPGAAATSSAARECLAAITKASWGRYVSAESVMNTFAEAGFRIRL
jgi:hypothetical protein